MSTALRMPQGRRRAPGTVGASAPQAQLNPSSPSTMVDQSQLLHRATGMEQEQFLASLARAML